MSLLNQLPNASRLIKDNPSTNNTMFYLALRVYVGLCIAVASIILFAWFFKGGFIAEWFLGEDDYVRIHMLLSDTVLGVPDFVIFTLALLCAVTILFAKDRLVKYFRRKV